MKWLTQPSWRGREGGPRLRPEKKHLSISGLAILLSLSLSFFPHLLRGRRVFQFASLEQMHESDSHTNCFLIQAQRLQTETKKTAFAVFAPPFVGLFVRGRRLEPIEKSPFISFPRCCLQTKNLKAKADCGIFAAPFLLPSFSLAFFLLFPSFSPPNWLKKRVYDVISNRNKWLLNRAKSTMFLKLTANQTNLSREPNSRRKTESGGEKHISSFSIRFESRSMQLHFWFSFKKHLKSIW